MNKKSLSTLEFYKITDQLVSYACCDGAKKILRNLKPMTDITDINLRLDETNDALSRIFQKGTVDFSQTKDIRASVARLKVGSSLNISELLNISAILSCAKHVKDYYEHREDSISGMLENLATVDALNSQIKKCIISEDEISDDASSNLRSIRRSKSIANDRIHSELNKLLNSPTYRTYLQDYVITTRQGRYCLPVKAEYKSAFPGMIHDQSSTGSTLFIEPAAVVKLNNDIRELELKEAAEIEVILADLSVKAGEHTEELLCNYEILVELDCIFAKAQLARHMHASRPVMNTSGIINIKKGRHPLIEPHIVVPIDIYLGTDFKLLIITGPNTGGKTVSLKTVGLLTLMAQSGLFIPALDHSDIAVFKNIYADIGDEQSIEQSLSTFSSHMTNTVKILKEADENCLVLFDEIEKAHPDVFNVLLQVLDDGRITDSKGKTVDFKNTILIMTSNIGSEYLLEGIDENGEIKPEASAQVMAGLKNHFRPEFLNRLDEIIMFKPLDKASISGIVNLLLADLNKRIADKELTLKLTDAAMDHVIEAGYDPHYGARPLKRYLQKNVETLVAKSILSNELRAGDTITLDYDGNALYIKK